MYLLTKFNHIKRRLIYQPLRIVFSISLMALILANYPKDDQITIHLIGDSTLSEKAEDKRPETGWGEKLSDFFNETVLVKNHAKNGRSTKTFREEGLWETAVNSFAAGDYVVLQFGHNDAKENSPRYASPEDYKKNLGRYIDEVRAMKGHPILLTPVMRRRFNNEGKFYDTHGLYPVKVRELAHEMIVPLIDIHELSKELFIGLGVEESKALFLWLEPGASPNYPNGLTDNTHFSPQGAKRIAELFVNELQKQKHPLAHYVKTNF